MDVEFSICSDVKAFGVTLADVSCIRTTVGLLYFLIIFLLGIRPLQRLEPVRGSAAVWQSKIGLCASHALREQGVLRARRTLVQAGWWRWA